MCSWYMYTYSYWERQTKFWVMSKGDFVSRRVMYVAWSRRDTWVSTQKAPVVTCEFTKRNVTERETERVAKNQ